MGGVWVGSDERWDWLMGSQWDQLTVLGKSGASLGGGAWSSILMGGRSGVWQVDGRGRREDIV